MQWSSYIHPLTYIKRLLVSRRNTKTAYSIRRTMIRRVAIRNPAGKITDRKPAFSILVSDCIRSGLKSCFLFFFVLLVLPGGCVRVAMCRNGNYEERTPAVFFLFSLRQPRDFKPTTDPKGNFVYMIRMNTSVRNRKRFMHQVRGMVQGTYNKSQEGWSRLDFLF